ncbi:MAG TPA: glycosyltransferase family 1 protein [Campylobacterales bacterium]|nr:glycosyltransferase family 1 protein [Campylobacterales bacterium]
MNKKVAYFIDTFFEINGVARTSQALLEQCKKEGREFKFITTYKGDYDVSSVSNFKPIISMPLPYYPELQLNICGFFEILRFCKREKFDIIYAPTPGVLGIYAVIISRILKLPLVSAFHTDFTSYMQKYTGSRLITKISKFFLRQTYNRSVRVLCPSKTYKDILIDCGVREEAIKIFTRGANTQKFNISFRDDNFWSQYIPHYHGETVVLYVGRVSDEKNISIFISLSEYFSLFDVSFVIVGDGPARKKLQESAHNVIFTGFFTGETLSKSYASSDIFLFPSETETFGNVILEACASGLCPIVSNKGASSEHIERGVNGYIAGSFEEYAKILKELFEDKELLNSIRTNAFSSVENVDANRLLSVMLDLIELK